LWSPRRGKLIPGQDGGVTQHEPAPGPVVPGVRADRE
jgi:hypothetical protein